jgi:hypothetical protein
MTRPFNYEKILNKINLNLIMAFLFEKYSYLYSDKVMNTKDVHHTNSNLHLKNL